MWGKQEAVNQSPRKTEMGEPGCCCLTTQRRRRKKLWQLLEGQEWEGRRNQKQNNKKKMPLCFTFGTQPKTGQDPGNSRKGYTDSQVKRLRMSAPSQYTEWSRKKWGGQGRGWGREGVLSEGRNDKDGHITEEEAVSKRLCFVKMQVEFKAVSEQKLGRKNRQWKRESRRGEDLFSMELGIVWKWSTERKKAGWKHSQLERSSRSKEKAWKVTVACIMLPEASDTNWGLSNQQC